MKEIRLSLLTGDNLALTSALLVGVNLKFHVQIKPFNIAGFYEIIFNKVSYTFFYHTYNAL